MQDRIPEKNARQGSRGKPVLYVLIASLVLLAVAITGLMTWQGANSPKDYASQSQDASRDTVTGSVTGKASTTKAPDQTGTAPTATGSQK